MEGLTLIVAADTIKSLTTFAWYAKWAISSKCHEHPLQGDSFSPSFSSQVENNTILLRSRMNTKEKLFKSSFYILNSKRVHIILVFPPTLPLKNCHASCRTWGTLLTTLKPARARGNVEPPIHAPCLTSGARSSALVYLAAALLPPPFALQVKQNSWQHSLILKIYRGALFLQNIFQLFLSTFGRICGNNLPWIFLSAVSS